MKRILLTITTFILVPLSAMASPVPGSPESPLAGTPPGCEAGYDLNGDTCEFNYCEATPPPGYESVRDRFPSESDECRWVPESCDRNTTQPDCRFAGADGICDCPCRPHHNPVEGTHRCEINWCEYEAPTGTVRIYEHYSGYPNDCRVVPSTCDPETTIPHCNDDGQNCECECIAPYVREGNSCVPQCAAYRFQILHEGFWGAGTGWNPPAVNNQMSDTIMQRIAEATALCADASRNLPWYLDYRDDCLRYYFAPLPAGQPTLYNGFRPPAGPYRPAASWGGDPTSPYQAERDPRSFTYYFLPDGTNVTEAPDGLVCDGGYYGWRLSPLSLVWEAGADPDSDIRVVEFPLNPAAKETHYLWKASSKLPLLVFDPADTGTVKNGAQLFGNWSFADKRLASLSSDPSLLDPHTPLWKDGFEALATLDEDGDGRISGGELKPVKLWFDNDQDAVVDSGEMKTLGDVGVVALFYEADRTETATRNIYATVGFERVVDGKRVTGQSVDWHSEGASDTASLIDKQLSKVQGRGVAPAVPALALPEKQAFLSGLSALPEMHLNGVFEWRATGSKTPRGAEGALPQGVLSFSEKKDGLIRGHSYSQVHFDAESNRVGSMLSMIAFVGSYRGEKNGHRTYEFTVRPTAESAVTTEVELLDNGEIAGTSTATAKVDGKNVSITYSWIGKPVESKRAEGARRSSL